jgi:hypothetical protein
MGFPLQVWRQAAGEGPRLGSTGANLACPGSRKAAKARQALAEGRDPLAILEPSKIPTFGEAADEYLDAKQAEWRNAKHAAQWRMTLQRYAAPLRPLPVDAITTEHVLACLKPIWTKRPETASPLHAISKVRRRQNAVNCPSEKSRGSSQHR